MLYYFRNCASNEHQVCCEDSPTKGLYYVLAVRWPCSSLKATTASHLYYNSNISASIQDMAFKLGMTIDLWLYACHICSCSVQWPWPWFKVRVGRQRQQNQRWIILKTQVVWIGSRENSLISVHNMCVCVLGGRGEGCCWQACVRKIDVYQHAVYLYNKKIFAKKTISKSTQVFRHTKAYVHWKNIYSGKKSTDK